MLRKRCRWIGPAALAAAILFGPLLLPVLPTLGRRFLGVEFVDHYGTQWFYWFAERQVRLLQSPAWTDLFFHPWGKDIYTHTGANLLDAFAAVPFRVGLGPVLGYNVFVLTMLACSGVAVAGLVEEVVGDRGAAAVAGVVAMASPFVVQELVEGRPTQAILLLPALLLRSLWRLGTRDEPRTAVAVGVLLAACGYQYWYYGLFGGLICLAHGAWRAVVPGAGGRVRTFARHLGAALIAVALVAPVAWPLAQSTQAGTGAIPGMLDVSDWRLGHVSTLTKDAKAAGLFLWQPLRAAFGFYTLRASGAGWLADRPALGPVLDLGLLVCGLPLLRPGRRGVVIAMASTAALIAIGPLLSIGSTYVGNPFYIVLARWVGVVQRLWWPGRAYAFVVLFVAIGVGALLSAVRRWILPASAALAAAFSGGLALRGEVPFPTWDATIPAGFRCLASGPPGGIVVLPADWQQGDVYYQVAHGRPMFGGMRDEQDMFVPAEWRQFRDGNSLMHALMDSDEPSTVLEWTPADEDSVRALGFRYIVLRLDRWEPSAKVDDALARQGIRNQRRRLLRALAEHFGAPVYTDARVDIYTLDGSASPCAADPVQRDPVPGGTPDLALVGGLGPETHLRDVVAPSGPW